MSTLLYNVNIKKLIFLILKKLYIMKNNLKLKK